MLLKVLCSASKSCSPCDCFTPFINFSPLRVPASLQNKSVILLFAFSCFNNHRLTPMGIYFFKWPGSWAFISGGGALFFRLKNHVLKIHSITVLKYALMNQVCTKVFLLEVHNFPLRSLATQSKRSHCGNVDQLMFNLLSMRCLLHLLELNLPRLSQLINVSRAKLVCI